MLSLSRHFPSEKSRRLRGELPRRLNLLLSRRTSDSDIDIQPNPFSIPTVKKQFIEENHTQLRRPSQQQKYTTIPHTYSQNSNGYININIFMIGLCIPHPQSFSAYLAARRTCRGGQSCGLALDQWLAPLISGQHQFPSKKLR